MNSNLLLNYPELKKLKKSSINKYILKNDFQQIFYFGANHSHDPKNKQYQILQKFWEAFLKNTKNEKRLVLVEGGVSKNFDSKAKAIKANSENGFISFLARNNKIVLKSPEPSLKYEVSELLKDYSKEEIEYYYFVRVIHQWHTIPNPRPEFNKYISSFLKKDQKVLGWKNFNFTISNLEKIHKKFFKKLPDYTNEKFFNDLMNPYKNTKVNRIASSSGRIRDIYILKEIQKQWKVGNNLFIVYGSNHAIMQKPALEEMIKTKTIFI